MCSSFEITIPVLNEELHLVPKVEEVLNFLLPQYSYGIHWSVVIADNGSTDKTSELSGNMVRQYNGLVKYIRLDERGVGRALKASWSQSTADIVGFFDLDLATDLNHIPQAISILMEQDYDIVYGTRLHKRSKVIGRSLKREVTSRIFNLILQAYLNVNLSDGMCGFKFLKRSIVDDLLKHGAVSDGWFFSTELLVVSETRGYKMYELPVIWTDSHDSEARIFSLTVEYLGAMRALKQLTSRNDT